MKEWQGTIYHEDRSDRRGNGRAERDLEETPDRWGSEREEQDSRDSSIGEDRSRSNKKIDRCLIVCLLLSAVLGVGAWMWLSMRNSSAQDSHFEPLNESLTATPEDLPISAVNVEEAGTPTFKPTDIPTVEPGMPTVTPSKLPTIQPTLSPSKLPTLAPTTQSEWIGNIIVNTALFGGQEFSRRSDSYQRKAMEWVIAKGNSISIAASDEMSFEELTIQLYALVSLYYSTYRVPNDVTNVLLGSGQSVGGWKTSRRWMMSGSSGGCDWHGVTCNPQGRVEKIKLPNNGLTGSIPPEVSLLKDSILYLDLYSNNIHNVGTVGNSFLGEMTNLQYLYLGETYFEHYGIPPELSNLSNLVELDISFTSWFGPLRSDPWSRLTNLEYLVMNGNVFNTPLPEELIRLPKLEYLYMVDSFLKGDLEWVSRMPVIRELWIDDNPLLTQIPESLSRATTLASFSAGSCGLMGAVPGSLGKLADSMTHLWLNDNALSSFIPGNLSKLSMLQTLSLVGNDFTSAVPSEICLDLGRLQKMEADASAHCECCTCCGHGSFSIQGIGTRTWGHRKE